MVFEKAGGRLLRIALIFTIMAGVSIGIMSYFTEKAMNDMKEIAMVPIEKDEDRVEVQSFYIQIIDNMKISVVLGSLSGVLIAIIARYGLREATRNLGEMKSKTEEANISRTSVSEEVEGRK